MEYGKLKLFIDDERTIQFNDWNVVRTYSQAVLMLSLMDFEVVSCDYTLDFMSDGKTGLSIIKWMIDNQKFPKEFIIHSTHIEGKEMMRKAAINGFPSTTKIIMNPIPKNNRKL